MGRTTVAAKTKQQGEEATESCEEKEEEEAEAEAAAARRERRRSRSNDAKRNEKS